MKKMSLFFAFIAFCAGPVIALAQDNDRSVIRIVNCSIDNGFTYDEVVERARNIDWGENSPNAVFFRRPIYTSDEYQQNNDLMIAAYYPNHTEMVNRRVALGNNSRGNLPITCSSPQVTRTYNVSGEPSSFEETAMTTRFCSLNDDASLFSAFNRISTVAENYVAAGDDSLVQMNIPSLGGPANSPWDFVLSVVGSSREGLTERMDMRLEGFRAEVGNGDNSSFSCDRPALWATTRIYTATN
tara:strand:- start:2503 stop:3228 length:726 start_codon:yes stop_codon:yes gene_type:complete